MYIVIAVLAILALVGSLLYVFVFKCEDDGSECTTTSDCCEGLECIDSKCSSSTPTVSPQPMVVNNVEPDPDPDPELTTCGNWDLDNNCAAGTTLTSETVFGNSQSECCVSDVDCVGEWSPCTAECYRTFTQTVAPSGSGAACPRWQGLGASACQPGEDDCPPNIDCAIDWTDWSPCSVDCGEGEQERTGVVSIPSSGTGAPCGDLRETQTCNLEDCTGEEWRYAINPGTNCDHVCQASGLVCQDGHWGVYDEDSMRGALREAGQDDDTLCRNNKDIPIMDSEGERAYLGMIASTGGSAPNIRLNNDRPCRYREGTHHGAHGAPTPGLSTCDGSWEGIHRLCKCVPE